MNVILFMVIYLVLYGGFMTVFGSAVSNAVYELLDYNYTLHTMLASTFRICSAIGFVLGIVLVVRSGINRGLRYFDLLLDSMSDILAKSGCPVMLPERAGYHRHGAQHHQGRLRAERARREGGRGAQERAGGVPGARHQDAAHLHHRLPHAARGVARPAARRARPLRTSRWTRAYRLEELLDEFFEITRWANLQAIPSSARFDGALFVNQVMDEFFPLAEGRRLELVYEGPAELSVFADAGRVARVLNNVIKNAVAYADPETDVWCV